MRSWRVAAELAHARVDLPHRWHGSSVHRDLAVSPDSRWIAIRNENNVMELLSLPGLNSVVALGGDSPAFSADGHWLVTVMTNRIQLFSMPDGRLQRTFEADTKLDGNPTFAPDSSRFAMATTVGSILIWSVTNSAPSLRVAATNRLEGLFFAREGSEIVALDATDGALECFDATTGLLTRRLATGEGSVKSVALSPDGKSVLIGETAPGLRLIDLESGRRRFLPSDMGSAVSVAWSADGQTIAAGTFEGFIKLWNARTLREVAMLRGHISIVSALEFSRDGRHLISGSFDSTWRLWSAPLLQETDETTGDP